MEFLRLFTAVRPPPQTIGVIADIQGQLKLTLGADWVRWVGSDNFHITLHFLGDTPAHLLPNLRTALDAGVHRFAVPPGGVELTLREPGAFPSLRKPRVIWVGVEDVDGTLRALHSSTGTALLDQGFSFDQKPFRGHITLGYVRKHPPGHALAAIAEAIGGRTVIPATRFSATDIVLVRSVLAPGGSQYTDLYSVALSAARESTSSGESGRE